jgi:hypothetical protein
MALPSEGTIFSFFEAAYPSVQLMIFLPQLPKGWVCRCVPNSTAQGQILGQTKLRWYVQARGKEAAPRWVGGLG